jgi:Flp pilus assembly protein TadG
VKPVVVRRGARIRSEAGAELVEFALVLPLLLAVFGGIVDFGLLLQRQQVVTNAAREGARLAIVGYPEAAVRARVAQFVQEGLNNPGAAPSTTLSTVTLTPGSGPAFQAARVQVQYNDRFLILGPMMSLAGGSGGSFGTITLSANTTMRIETAATAGS